MRGEQGFTLIELMVVIVILGVLVAIVIALYQDLQARSRLAADHGTLGAMRSAITLYYGKHAGNFPASPGNYVVPTPPPFQCSGLTYSYNASTGLLVVTSTNTAQDCP